MRFGILGPLHVMQGDRSVALRGNIRRTLLGVLLLEPNRPISIDRLISDLWGEEAPKDPIGALFQAASRLRKTVGAHLETHPGAYLARVTHEELDTLRFEAVVEAGKKALVAGQAGRAGASFAEALGLWRGPLLADLPDLLSADGERNRFDGLRRLAIEGRIEAELASGHHSEILPELERLVDQEPYGERAWGLLMLALYRAGRQRDALATYRRARSLLTEELGIEPGSALRSLEERILLQDPALQVEGGDGGKSAGNLRSDQSSLVGRRQELAEVSELVRAHRMVTMTGPGGTGKTRLAVEVGLQLRTLFPDGAWLVDLDPVTDPQDAPRAVAAVLGLREVIRESAVIDLARHVQNLRALLILDNCEHLVGAVGEIADGLLAGCPGLRIFATSRLRIGLQQEAVYRLHPLTVPDDDGPDPVHSLLSSDAGQLLVTRALAASNGLRISRDWAVAAIGLCRRLDGLPLAIELAAARLGSMDMRDLLDRLEKLLADTSMMTTRRTARHASLEAALIWSHDLLPQDEAKLFRRLAVFRGPFGIDAAESVGGSHLAAAQALSGLVDRSLVEIDRGLRRYRMLQTVRAFARRRLVESGEEAEIADSHADFMLSLAEGAVPLIQGPDQVSFIERLEASHDDVLGAHERLANNGDPRVLSLVGALWWFWFRHGHVLEGRQLLEEAIAAVPAGFDEARASAWQGLAHMSWFLGDYSEAKRCGAEALDIGRTLADEALVVLGLAIPAVLARDAEGDFVRATNLLENRSRKARKLQDPWILATSLSLLATVAAASQNRSKLVDALGESSEIYASMGDTWGLAWSHLLDGFRAILDGSFQEASALCGEAFRLAVVLNHRAGMPAILSAQALADSKQGRPERAAVLLGVIRALEKVTGVKVPVPERNYRSIAMALVTQHLGGNRASQLHAQGAMLRARDAQAFILDEVAEL